MFGWKFYKTVVNFFGVKCFKLENGQNTLMLDRKLESNFVFLNLIKVLTYMH